MKKAILSNQQTPIPGPFYKPVLNRAGNLLVYLVVVILIFGVLGVSLVSLFTTATQSGATPNDARRARYIAESGIRYALSEIRNTDNFVDTAQKLNDTTDFKLGKNGSFTVNVFSPGNVSLVHWEDFEGTTPPSTSYAVISDFTIADPPESVSIDVADDFQANVGDPICFALQATDADTRIKEGEFIYVAEEAADILPAEGGAIRILANGIKYDYYYEERKPPVANKVKLTNLRAMPGGNPWTDILNLNATDYVILSPNNFRLIASGTSDDITIEIGNNKPYWAFAPPLATGYTIYMDDLLNANVIKQSGDVIQAQGGADKKIELGGGSEGFGDLWDSGNKATGGDTDRCNDGRCNFDQGIRVFFTASLSGNGEGFTFALIAGGDIDNLIDPPPNTSRSAGGDFQLPELLAYGGSSWTSSGTYLDESGGEGLKPPKMALEFDTRTNFSFPLDYCTANNLNLIPGSRNDPQPNGLDMDVVQFVFWGSNAETDLDALGLSCRSVAEETYDDNRHDAEGYELSPNWGYDVGTGAVSSPAIDKTGGTYDGTIYAAANGNDVFAFKPDGTLKWTRDLGSDIRGAPAVGSDGTVFTGNDGDKMYALQPWNGLNAHTPFSASGDIRSRPAIDGSDNVYFGTTNGLFYKLGSNLVKKWTFTNADAQGGASPAPILTSPALSKDENTVYFGTDDTETSNFYALDTTSAPADPDDPPATRWGINKGAGPPDHIRSSPAVDMTEGQDHSGYIYFGTDNDLIGRLFAIEPINGNEKGSFSTTDKILSSPAVDDNGDIYVGSDEHKFYALEVGAGGAGLSDKWSDGDPPVGVVRSGPAVNPNDGLQKGTIYVGSKRENVLAYYPNGDLKWEFINFPGKEGTHPEDQIDADPAVGKDDFVYVGDIDDNLYSLATVSLPRNYRSDHPDFHEVPSGKADNADYEINHKAHITHRDLGPGGLDLTDTNDWLNGGPLLYPWAVRMEVEKTADRTYELKTWIRQCTIGDCSDILSTHYQNTERKYNYTPATLTYADSSIKTLPLTQKIVLDAAGDARDELFERILFGFTTASGAPGGIPDDQLITIRDFQLTFISAFEEAPVDDDSAGWPP
jgi:hypothetical protein